MSNPLAELKIRNIGLAITMVFGIIYLLNIAIDVFYYGAKLQDSIETALIWLFISCFGLAVFAVWYEASTGVIFRYSHDK